MLSHLARRAHLAGLARLARAFVAIAALGLTFSLSPRVAFGGGTGFGGTHEPFIVSTRVGIETELTGFELDGRAGSFTSIWARADYSPTSVMSLRLRVPVHALSLGDETRAGLGDTEIRVKFRVLAVDGERFLVFAGVNEQLPTGSASRGLGDGAAQLSPYVTAGYKIGGVIPYATLADAFSLHGKHARRYVNYVDPNSDHELRYDLGAIVSPDPLFINAALSGVTILDGDDLGVTLFTAGAQLGVNPSKRLRLVAGGQLPIAGPRRFDWKASLDAYVFF